MKMRDLKRSAYRAMHQAMAESREVGKAQERQRILELLTADSENSVNGNPEIPETASNLPDTNPDAFGARRDYFAGMTRGRIYERERMLKQINDLINAVVDYTLTPSQYDQATQRITEIIKGEQND